MKKGFTLVELLAVLIIIAVIGVIAIPIVSDMISDSKRKSAEAHLKNIARQVTNYYRNEELNGHEVTKVDLTTNKIEYDGEKPEKGIVEYDNNGDYYIEMYYKGYCLRKDYTGDTYIEKTSIEECNIGDDEYEGSPEECFTFDSTTGTILKYDKENENCPMNVVIPNRINNVLVKRIGSGAFINSIISQYCLDNDANPIEVDIDYDNDISNDYIECHFNIDSDQNRLTGVDFSKVKFLKSIGYYAFTSNDLTSVTIPSSISSISLFAFALNDIDTVNLPNKKITLGNCILGYNPLSNVVNPYNLDLDTNCPG